MNQCTWITFIDVRSLTIALLHYYFISLVPDYMNNMKRHTKLVFK